MAQGTRVSANLFHENGSQDLFVEVDHGPFLVDNNIFLSPMTLLVDSQGGAFVHNLIAGGLRLNPYDRRLTPFHQPHSTAVAGMHDNPCGDNRYYNNLFMGGSDWTAYDKARLPVSMEGNVFLHYAKPSHQEQDPLVMPEFDPALKLDQQPDEFTLEVRLDKAWAAQRTRKLVTTERLGKAIIPQLPYERPDGSPIRIDRDYFGNARTQTNPLPGPFEPAEGGMLRLKVWPVATR
jgi:alpha-N-arabinofuranosidase